MKPRNGEENAQMEPKAASRMGNGSEQNPTGVGKMQMYVLRDRLTKMLSHLIGCKQLPRNQNQTTWKGVLQTTLTSSSVERKVVLPFPLL
jgi:hypothetical protein